MDDGKGPWFVGNNANGSGASGFTDSLDNALRDRHGAPVLAGGTYRRLVSVVVGRMEAVQKKKLDMMWEQLFDVNDDLDAKTQRLSVLLASGDDATGLEAQISFAVGMRRAMIRMISIQQLGNAEPSATAMIERELKEAYEDDESEQPTDPNSAPAAGPTGEAGGDDQQLLQGGNEEGGGDVGDGQPHLQEESQEADAGH